jgi:hypothetical protein
VAFFDEMRSRFGLTGTVLYAGDSATDFVPEGTRRGFQAGASELIAIQDQDEFGLVSAPD